MDTCYCQPSEKAVIGKSIGLGRESTTVVLLIGHGSKLLLNLFILTDYCCSEPYTQTLLFALIAVNPDS